MFCVPLRPESQIVAKAWSFLPRDMRQVFTALYAQEKLQGA